MKSKFIPLFTFLLLISCQRESTKKQEQSIVGVWEMITVIFSSQSHWPGVELTNKKDIYTQDGIYHNTAADSNRITDTTLRKYTFENGVMKVFNGQSVRQAKITFLPMDEMSLTQENGDRIIFRRISKDPNNIPIIKECVVNVSVGTRSW